MSATDFTIAKYRTDTVLLPRTGRATAYCAEYRKVFGEEAMAAGDGIFVETSRDKSRLTDAVADLRAAGFSAR